MKSRLYYEAHITVQAKEPEFWNQFAHDAERAEWRASKFDVDDVDATDGQWFLSARFETLEGIKMRVQSALNALRKNNYEVLRWKIEDTVLDSKHGDLEEALS